MTHRYIGEISLYHYRTQEGIFSSVLAVLFFPDLFVPRKETEHTRGGTDTTGEHNVHFIPGEVDPTC